MATLARQCVVGTTGPRAVSYRPSPDPAHSLVCRRRGRPAERAWIDRAVRRRPARRGTARAGHALPAVAAVLMADRVWLPAIEHYAHGRHRWGDRPRPGARLWRVVAAL